jgi:hypothetical protein
MNEQEFTEENLIINIQLGDFIELDAPSDTDIHNHTYYIKFLDNEKVVLLEESGEEIILKLDETGKLFNESIIGINILNRADAPGYAVQNNLITGTWIDMYFKGDIPLVITGKITNVEEDMIEITTFPTKDVLFIDFGYKGIPDDLNIEKINVRSEPAESASAVEAESIMQAPSTEAQGTTTSGIEPVTPVTPSASAAEAAKPSVGQQTGNVEELGDVEDEYALEIEEPSREEIKKLIFRADQIIFGDEEMELSLVVDLPESQQRFGIEKQTQDLLDDMLSTVPNIQRTPAVLNKIHQMIDRYKQLRNLYSKFDENGNANMPDIKGADYKPLVEILSKFEQKLHWILPVVKTNKKLYIDGGDEEENNDTNITVLELADIRTKEQEILKTYQEGGIPDGENKYVYLMRELNSYSIPFLNPSDTENDLTIQKVNGNINAVAANLDDFNSSVVKFKKGKKEEMNQTNIVSKRFFMQEYTTGLSYIETVKTRGTGEINTRKPITANDTITVKSYLTLPEVTVRFSRVNLPGTDILIKSTLNKHFIQYWQFLNNNTRYSSRVVDDLDKPLEYKDDLFVNDIKEYILDESLLDAPDKYKRYLKTIIPKTRVLFNIMKPYINGKLSVHEVLSYLEPFMVYHKDLSFMQYQEITEFIKNKITDFKKNYIGMSRKFATINANSNKSNKSIKNLNIYLNELFILNDPLRKELLVNFYGFDSPAPDMSISEFMKKLETIDNGRLFNACITVLSLNLISPVSPDAVIAEMKTFIEEVNDDLSNPRINICNQYKNIAKRYLAIDELEDDNFVDIFFDKKYDTTFYSIYNDEYKDKLMSSSASDQEEKLTAILIKKNGFTPENAKREAKSMIVGKRLVENGDFAILDMLDQGNSEMIYYVRDNNEWKLLPEGSNNQVIDDKSKSICNFQEACIENAKTSDCNDSNFEVEMLKNKNMTQMINEFDNTLKMNKTQREDKAWEEYDLCSSRIKTLINVSNLKRFVYENQKYLLGHTAVTIDKIVSPHAPLRDLILGQSDFSKRNQYICEFVLNFTREPALDATGEEKYWLYCINTHTKLLPIFIYQLADVFLKKGDYKKEMDRICAEQGTMSDDGDSWVDKYSGETICKINWAIPEEFGGEGARNISLSTIEADLGDAITQEKKTQSEFENPEAIKISKVINTMSSYIGINLDAKKEFIIRNVMRQQSSIMPNKEAYEKAINSASSEKKKKIKAYDDFYNESLMLLILSYYLVAIQISIPAIKTRKTHPGCIKSFTGFPLDGSEDTSAIMYIACVASKMEKRSIVPWSGIAGFKDKDLFIRIQGLISKFILKDNEVQERIKEKLKYLLINKEEDIPEEHNILRWNNFLPQLRPFKLKTLQDISAQFKDQLIQTMREKNKKQDEMILTIKSKIIFFSLGIQELIQKTVHKKNAILTNANFEPFLENACCDNEDINALKYFIKEQPDIASYNNSVKILGNLIDDLTRMGKAGIMYDPKDTKREFLKLPETFSEETIYRAFIVFCKYNNDMPISEELRAICLNKPDNYDKNDTIEESIRKLKRDGKLYTTESLEQLLTLVNRDNMVKLKINTPINNLTIDVLKHIISSMNERDTDHVPKVFRDKFMNILTQDETDGLFEDTKEMRELKNYLSSANEKMKGDIIECVRSSSKIKGSDLKSFTENLENITTLKETGNNTFMENADETIYKMVGFIKNAIRDMVSVFPNMILNKVEYSTVKIPTHWALSQVHETDLKTSINSHYSVLYKLYDDPDIVIIMRKLMNLSKDIELLANNTFFNTPLNIGDQKYMYSIFDRRLTMMLFKFYFYSILTTLISLRDDSEVALKNIYKAVDARISSIDDELMSIQNASDLATGNMSELDIVMGDKKELSDKIAMILTSFMSVIDVDKKSIDFNYTILMERILRSKEREKDVITENFKKMTDETRQVQDLIKNHRLEQWNKGMQKGLFRYEKDTYDDERAEQDRLTKIDIMLKQKNQETNDTAVLELTEQQLADEEMDMEDNQIDYMGEDADYDEMGMDGDEMY